MSSRQEIHRQVEERTRQRCEYRQMHQTLQGATFHLEHVVPSSRGGPTALHNLAWACPGCNSHKADRTFVPDPDTNQLVPLFHPRNHRWADHFRWDGHRIVGLTATGRATVFALDLNQSRRLFIRQAEELVELFPPD